MFDKTALITGASSGLGKQLALVFAENNYNLILSGRDNFRLGQVKEEINQNIECTLVQGDLRDSALISNLYELSKENGVDFLINNAGAFSNDKITQISETNLEEIIQTNLIAPMKLVQKIYPLLLNKGTIINIGSIDAIYPKPNLTAYCASKFGLRGFTESLKFEAKNDGIRVMGVYLGGMQTPMNMKRGVDVSKAMNPKEVAQIIFDNSKRYSSSGIDEIVINRQNY